MRHFVRLLAGLMVVAGVIAATAWGVDRRRTITELKALQEDVQVTRASVQSCQSHLASREAAFQDFDDRLSALRERLGDFESADGPAVPAEQYDDYLVLFAAYNDSVQVWEVRSESLRSRAAACRTLVERHNALVDTLRMRLVKEKGLGQHVKG